MLHVENISKQYPTKILFATASVHLRPHTRVGLVGPNGAGKTTLMRVIMGEDAVDEGTIRKRPWLRIGYLPQDLQSLPGRTVLESTHRDQFPEHEAKRILSGLGFQEGDWDRSLSTLSGGYRMRVALAHLLLFLPDVLMLDEPTNHLDKATQSWLESFLLSAPMTLLMISHDTVFLDRLVTHIWDLRDYQIQEYRGHYSRFQQLRHERDAQQAAAASRQSKEIERVQTFVDRFRYKANKARQVQSRIKQLDKVKRIEQKRNPKRIRLTFPVPQPSGKLVLELQGVKKRYGETVVYDGLDYIVERGQRVALVGENGAGKTTLLKILAGVLACEDGKRILGHGVTLQYFVQHQAEILNPEHTILESLAEASPRAEMNFLRRVAGTFLFSGPDQTKPIKALSGGERNRVALARMLAEPANTLLLDEPTNHLDPASVDVLTDALTEFPGTIVFISHDPTFLARVATRVVEIENGQARDYIGDYEFYLWKRSQELETSKDDPQSALGTLTKSKSKSKKKSDIHLPPGHNGKGPVNGSSRRDLSKSVARLCKQVKNAEDAISHQEETIRLRDQELADPDTYQDFARWHTLHQEREEWKVALEQLTNRWADLSTEMERLQTQLKALGCEDKKTIT